MIQKFTHVKKGQIGIKGGRKELSVVENEQVRAGFYSRKTLLKQFPLNS